MKPLVLFLSTALSLTLSSVPADAQVQNPQAKNVFRVRVDSPSGWWLWDDSRSELVNSGNQSRQVERATAFVNIYNVASGEKRSIDILKEFPNAQYVDVTGLTSGPDGAVLVVCKVNLDDSVFTGDRLLEYDNHSMLVVKMTTADYDVGAAAMDKRGNIYLVGTHDGENSSDESYPLLLKYDAQGHITLETLSRSLFANIDDPIAKLSHALVRARRACSQNPRLQMARQQAHLRVPSQADWNTAWQHRGIARAQGPSDDAQVCPPVNLKLA